MKDKLVRENEKLKNDNKSNKRMLYGASSAITSQIPNYMQKFMKEKDPQNTSFGHQNNLNLVNTSINSGKFGFKNFIGDGSEKLGDSEKSADVSEDKSTTSQKENLI